MESSRAPRDNSSRTRPEMIYAGVPCRNAHRKSSARSTSSRSDFLVSLAPSYRSGWTRTKKRPRRIHVSAALNPKQLNGVSASVHAATSLRRRRRGECSDQLRIRQAAPDDVTDHFAEPIRVVHLAPIVESERLFIEVSKQMKRFNRDVRAAKRTLQQRPKVFAAVRVNLSVYVLLRVVNDLVDVLAVVAGAETSIRRERIGVHGRTGFDIRANTTLDLFPPSILHNGSSDDAVTGLAVALKQSLYGDFPHVSVRRGLHRALFPFFVHESRFAADERLVYFNLAPNLAACLLVLHRKANALQHEPRGLLCDADAAVNFPRADAVLAVGDHPHCG